jgi:hypothetical protein
VSLIGLIKIRLNGDPSNVAAVCLYATVQLRNLLAGHRNFGQVLGQVVPKLADEREFFAGRLSVRVGHGSENHGIKIVAADFETSSEAPATN